MIVIYTILTCVFIALLIAYWLKKPIFRHVPWLWRNIGRPLRDHILVISVRKITLGYFAAISGLSFSLPYRKIGACMATEKSIGWFSFEFDDGNIDLYTCIAIVALTVAYIWFLKYETRKLDRKEQSWIDRLLKKFDDGLNLLSVIAQNKKKCQILYADGSDEMVISPTFAEIKYVPEQRDTNDNTSVTPTSKEVLDALIKGSLSEEYIQSIINEQLQTVQPVKVSVCIGKQLKSYSPIHIVLHSTGRDPLDEVYIQIAADNKDVLIIDTNRKESSLYKDLIELQNRYENRRIADNRVKAHIGTLNGGLVYNIAPFYVKAPHDCQAFHLVWKVNARSFQAEGTLHVIVRPNFVYQIRTSNKRAGDTSIEDYEEDITDTSEM